MKRVSIQGVRKVYDLGVNIYLLHSNTEYVKGTNFNAKTSKLYEKDFDVFVNKYKESSGKRLHYYIDENEVEVAKRIRDKHLGSNGVKQEQKLDDIVNNKHKLMEIGSKVALIWGGRCYDYSVDKKAKKVTFYCREHGESFLTSLKFDELKEYL